MVDAEPFTTSKQLGRDDLSSRPFSFCEIAAREGELT
jgi:hypothetical protein